MNLRYILLSLDYDTYSVIDNDLRYEFQCHTRFICNYLSKKIRTHNFDTNGIYNMISVSLLPEAGLKTTNTAIDILETYLQFEPMRYEQIKGTDDCSYYLEVLEQGFRKAAEFKPVPLDTLLHLIDEFKQGGCKNEWLHKKRRFKEADLQVVLTCEFTTNYFQLVATVNQLSTKRQLVRGIAIKTRPDEIFYRGTFKDILIEGNKIVITDNSDKANVLIDIDAARNGIFKRTFAPYIYREYRTPEYNNELEETHNSIIRMLSYDGEGF